MYPRSFILKIFPLSFVRLIDKTIDNLFGNGKTLFCTVDTATLSYISIVADPEYQNITMTELKLNPIGMGGL